MGVCQRCPPTFDRRENHWDEDADDDDVADLTDGVADATTDAAELDTGAQRAVRTATDGAAHNVDWNGIDSSDDPTLATLWLLYSARQMAGTSKWWTLRWPNNAISLLGTACGLNTALSNCFMKCARWCFSMCESFGRWWWTDGMRRTTRRSGLYSRASG